MPGGGEISRTSDRSPPWHVLRRLAPRNQRKQNPKADCCGGLHFEKLEAQQLRLAAAHGPIPWDYHSQRPQTARTRRTKRTLSQPGRNALKRPIVPSKVKYSSLQMGDPLRRQACASFPTRGPVSGGEPHARSGTVDAAAAAPPSSFGSSTYLQHRGGSGGATARASRRASRFQQKVDKPRHTRTIDWNRTANKHAYWIRHDPRSPSSVLNAHSPSPRMRLII